MPEGFVLVKGVPFESQGQVINTGDFEILDHPVTNNEYKRFTDETGFPAPPHWENGIIPEGKEDYPVIFVNRVDVYAYSSWLTEKSGRIYRIPTEHEFRLASKGGLTEGERYSGEGSGEGPDMEKVNFNNTGDRKYDQWKTYLKPSKWGMSNELGLFQMSGNVWQLVARNEDPAVSTFKYRIEKLIDLERAVMGGSWMSTKESVVGGIVSMSPGMRLPDLGIRLVREPEGANWKMQNRRVSAVTNSPGKICISWNLLDSDTKNTHFNIYRLEGSSRSHNGIRLNTVPLLNTSFIDENGIIDGSRYQYRVMATDETGNEGNPSDWASITAGVDKYPIAVKFKPLFEKGGMLPVFGNIEGYGKLNCVIRLDNGCKETSQDPGKSVQLEAFSYTGRSLWRKDIARHENIYGSASNAPFNVWDMNGDGKDEVITLYQIEENNYLSILDGMSGKVLDKTLWDTMATDFSKSSTRIQMSVGYLDGKNPAIITQTGLYENEIISAYDKKLNKLWTYNSFMETSGSGGHKVEIADVDDNGNQEVIYGTTCLNSDGTMRWSIYKNHPDIISIHDYIPDRKGLEICFIVESSAYAGIYMVDANSGELIWKNNRDEDPLWSHGHYGWTADIWNGASGMECVTNRMGHYDVTYLLFSSAGQKLSESFPVGYTPVEWDGDPTRELLGEKGKVIGNFDGTGIVEVKGQVPNPVPASSVVFTADLCGDFRSEIVIKTIDSDGRPAIMVVMASDSINKRYVTPFNDIDYRLWLARNIGGGYGSVYEYVLKQTSN
jgi:rhamnogalacturonan endolyase